MPAKKNGARKRTAKTTLDPARLQREIERLSQTRKAVKKLDLKIRKHVRNLKASVAYYHIGS